MKSVSFKPFLAQAVHDELKTQTRRAINPQPDARGLRSFSVPFEDWHGREVKCPYGNVGDVLYVREQHYVYGKWIKNGTSQYGKQKWKFEPIGKDVKFSPKDIVVKSNAYRLEGWYKRSAMFMPAEYARTFIRIEDLSAERLQGISEEDAIAEGIERWVEQRLKSKPTHYKVYIDLENPRDPATYSSSAICSFQTLWHLINGKESWDSNPWVWVIKFKKVDKPI